MTCLVIVSTLPFTAIWPPPVMVQLLPPASMIAAVEGAVMTVSLGDGGRLRTTSERVSFTRVPPLCPAGTVKPLTVMLSVALFGNCVVPTGRL